jgi:hypothetical protein
MWNAKLGGNHNLKLWGICFFHGNKGVSDERKAVVVRNEIRAFSQIPRVNIGKGHENVLK